MRCAAHRRDANALARAACGGFCRLRCRARPRDTTAFAGARPVRRLRRAARPQTRAHSGFGLVRARARRHRPLAAMAARLPARASCVGARRRPIGRCACAPVPPPGRDRTDRCRRARASRAGRPAARGARGRLGSRSRLGSGGRADDPLPLRLGGGMRAAVLDDLPETAATHFRLYFYAAIIELVREAAIRAGSMENLLERHGFLAPYLNELAERGLEGGTLEQAPGWWRQAVERWEPTVAERLPLRELAGDAALDYESRILLVGAGLAAEDGRVASLFDGAAPATGRPGAGLLTGWCTHLEAGAVRARVRRLRECGLFHIPNADACFPNWQVEGPSVLWGAVRCQQIRLNLPWAHFRGRDQIKPPSSLCLSEPARSQG